MSRYAAFAICLFFGLVPGRAAAQNYNNPGGVITACSGNFYDTGGAAGNYDDDEDITTTFCSPTGGECITVSFTAFNIEDDYDFLEIYDGPSAASPLIGIYTGTASPGVVTSTYGCLTFVFTSDFAFDRAGWQAALSCAPCPPCAGVTPACSSPAPDDCASACNLGVLNAPSLCVGNTSTPASNFFCLNNLGATPSLPYNALGGCQPSGNDMPDPAADVWFTFTASSHIIDLSIIGLSSPNLALYEGNNCNTFIGRGCATGAFGNLSGTFQPIRVGARYYLRVAGGDTTDTGDFTLRITSRTDCDPCLLESNLTANPLPSGTVYQPGTTVRFCFTVTRWNQTANNWIHAVVPSFGPGWDVSSIVPSPPASCDGDGDWGWYNSVTSAATGLVTGPGFFYEQPLGCPAGTVCSSNNPGDNFGDDCEGIVNFPFCWDITVADCPPAQHGDNLNVSVNTYGDGETGSWTSFACAADPIVDFFASLSCCPQPNISQKHIRCPGAQDGWIIADAEGIAPFDYVWLDGSGNIIKNVSASAPDTLSGLAGGVYTVEIKDALQCFTSTTVTLIESPALSLTLDVSDVTCAGANDGSFSVNFSGGTQPYQYSLDGANFQGASIFTSLAAGNYTVTARDDSNCIAAYDTFITEPSPLVITLDSLFHSACFEGNNGAVYVTVSGGTVPYVYEWSNNAASEDITGLPADDYTLEVTDFNGCILSDMYSVTAAGSFTLDIAAGDVTCNGGSDGWVNVTVTGGMPPIIFSWSNNDSSEDLTGIPAGSYSVIVTDGNQCSDTIAADVNEPPAIVLEGLATHPVCQAANSGSIDLTATGGVPPLTFLWSTSDTSKDLTGVPQGVYTVVATDFQQCTEALTLVLVQPDSFTMSSVKTDVRCAGGNDGAINLTITGGTLPLFFWSNNERTEDLAGLIAMDYSVTVIDANACTAEAFFSITEPDSLAVTGNITNVLCNGEPTGSIDADATGGTAPYSFLWSTLVADEDLTAIPAGSYMLIVTDPNQCADTSAYVVTEPPPIVLDGVTSDLGCFGDNSGAIDINASGGSPPFYYIWSTNDTTEDLAGVPAGNYSVIATDTNSCSETISFTLSQPDSIELSFVKNDVSCFGKNDGAVNLSVSGGVLPYQFLWSNSDTTEDISDLPAATYNVLVLDAHNCEAAISVNITEPFPLVVTANVTDVLCNGEATGAIDVAITGGTLPYGFQWSNSTSAEDLTSAPAGNYVLTVTDANSCADTSSHVIAEPSALSLGGTAVDARCFFSADGEIHLIASDGTPPYQFSINGIHFQQSPDFINVPGGNYQPLVIDAVSCEDSISLTVNTPPAIITTVAVADASCNGGDDGQAVVTAVGVNSPFTFNWSSGSADDTAGNLAAGVYYVTVADANGCPANDTAVVDQPGEIILTAIIIDVLCQGDSSGSINLTASGGTPGYLYAWTNNESSPNNDTLPAGNYSVTVTDGHQCTAGGTYTVSEPPLLQLSSGATATRCNGENNGSAHVTAAGGTPDYSYQWDAAADNQTTSAAIGLYAGDYSMTITDANHCSVTGSVTVTEPPPLVVAIDTSANPLCHGESTGFAAAAASGGTPLITYLWSNAPPSTASTMTDVSAGFYSVTAADGNGCEASASVTLDDPPPLTVTIFPLDTTINLGDSIRLVAVHSPSGITPSYLWEPSDAIAWCISPCAEPVVAPNLSTVFTVLLRTEGGNCTATAEATVNVEYDNYIHAPNVFSPDGDGVNDVFEIFFSPSLTAINYMIFNRWGEQLFQTNTIGEFWNGNYRGKPQNPGVYVYLMEGSFMDGVRKQYSGSLTLLR